MSGGNVQTGEPPSAGLFLQRFGSEQLQRAGQRGTERLRLEVHPAARPIQQPPAALDLLLQIFLPFACRFELLVGAALLLLVQVGGFDLSCKALRVPVTDAAAQSALDVVVDHLGEAAEFALDGLRLADQHFQHAILGALREHEVVAADLRGRLQLAVDAPVALLDAAGVPGQVEVEQVGAVRLEVQSLAGGVGGDQDAQRIVRRVPR